MKVPTLLYISLVILFEVHAKKLDSGPSAVNESTSATASVSDSSTFKTSELPSQTKKKRYATKEVILYLTPSQIQALQTGEGFVGLQSLSESVDQEQLTNQDLKLQEQTEFVKQEFENLKSASIQQVEHSDEEKLELSSQEPIFHKELLSTEIQQELDNQWRQELAHREEQVKLHNYYHELNKAEQLRLQQEVNGERNAYLAYHPNLQISEGYRVHEPDQDDHIVDRNPFQVKALSPVPLDDQHSENFLSQIANQLLQLTYSPKYNDQEKTIEIEKILMAHHHHELEKQSTVSKVEKIADTPALFDPFHGKITKQHEIPIVQRVKVSVPTPVWVSVPEPVPVRILHPYPALQQVIKHTSVPMEQRERGEIERTEPHVERKISEPFTKIVFVNVGTPYDPKIVPVGITSKSWR